MGGLQACTYQAGLRMLGLCDSDGFEWAAGNGNTHVRSITQPVDNWVSVTYIYAMFYRFGIIDVLDDVKERIELGKNKDAEQMNLKNGKDPQ